MKEVTLQLFESLISALKLDPVTINEEGHCSLVFDNELIVNIALKESEFLIVFTSLIGMLAEENSNQQLRNMMALNLAVGRQHNMTLGLEPETNMVLLIHRVDVRRTYPSTLEEALSLVLCQTEKCQSMLELMVDETDLGPQTDPKNRFHCRA